MYCTHRDFFPKSQNGKQTKKLFKFYKLNLTIYLIKCGEIKGVVSSNYITHIFICAYTFVYICICAYVYVFVYIDSDIDTDR